MITQPVLLLALFFGVHSFVEKGRDAYFGSSDSSGSSEQHHHNRPRPPRPTRTPEVTTPSVPQCPSGWLTFDRPQGRWCVAVFSGTMNQPAAEQQCRLRKATLTGVQNSEERMKLADECRRFQRAHGLPDGSMWLGAHRKARCSNRALCAPHDAFAWTDGHTRGVDGWGFANAQPDGGVINGVAQDCVHLISYVNGRIGSNPNLWPGMFHNNMDDMHCTIANSVALYYACGRKP